MTRTITEKEKYTYEDYLKTPDDERYELIEGDLLMTPAPATKHQRVLRKLVFLLEDFMTHQDLGEVFCAPYDVYLDNRNVVQPDILFVSKERLNIIGEKNIQGAPDLVIEITSEATAYRDLVRKKKLYGKHGVKEYWIVDPMEETVEVYLLREAAYTLVKTCQKDDVFESECLKRLKIELKRIF